MKIVHCCLSNYYVDNYNYQENVLSRQNKWDGHQVLIIASTEIFVDGKVAYTTPKKYLNEDGIEVIRVPYKKILPHAIMKKVRAYDNVYNLINDYKPDVIFFHGMLAKELLTIVEYKKRHPLVKVYGDYHADYTNSARNLLSKYVLHKMYYKRIIQGSVPWIEKIFCITISTINFVSEMYQVPYEKLEFYPLGGEIFADSIYEQKRNHIRESLEVKENDILFVHSGKMDKYKRTVELLEAFTKVKNDHFKLVIIGVFLDNIQEKIQRILDEDKRVVYVGWKDSKELVDYLCAADMYLQPGSQSVTMQNAMCCSCALMIYPVISHEPYLHGNGFYVNRAEDLPELEIKNKLKNVETSAIEDVFEKIANQPEILEGMKKQSLKIAKEKLDYKKLAARIYR